MKQFETYLNLETIFQYGFYGFLFVATCFCILMGINQFLKPKGRDRKNNFASKSREQDELLNSKTKYNG